MKPVVVEDLLDPLLSREECQNLIDDVEEMDNTVKAWRDVSGMQTLLEELEKRKNKTNDINDIVLSLAAGVEEGADKAVNGVLESAVVAALLISFSIPLVVVPPDAIAELGNDDWHKIVHLVGWGALSVMGIANILYARIYTAAMARAPRSVDKLRINLAGNAYTDGLLMIYSMFSFIVLGLIPDVHIFYGDAMTVIFMIVTGLFPVWIAKVAYKYINAGHIEYGWRGNRISRNDPVNDMLLFETLQRRMQHGERLRSTDRPFFAFSQKQSDTMAKGISEEGKSLMGLAD